MTNVRSLLLLALVGILSCTANIGCTNDDGDDGDNGGNPSDSIGDWKPEGVGLDIPEGSGVIWHVASTGTDEEGCGTSLENACFTLDYVADGDSGAGLAEAGDTVYLHSPTVDEQFLYPNSVMRGLKGNESGWVTIMGAPGEDMPEIRVGLMFSSDHNDELTDVGYLVLRDLKFQGPCKWGEGGGDTDVLCLNIDDGGEYQLATPAHHILLDHLVMDGGRIKMSGVDHFEIKDTIVRDIEFPEEGGNTAFNLDGDHYGWIHHNTVTNVGNLAVIKGGARQIVLSHNFFSGNSHRTYTVILGDGMDTDLFRPSLAEMDASGEPRWQLKEVSVYSNIVISMGLPFVIDQAQDTLIAHNTVVRVPSPDPEDAEFYGSVRVKDGDNDVTPPRDVTMVNNLFYFPTRESGWQNVNFQYVDHTSEPDDVPQTYGSTFSFLNNFWYCHDEPENAGCSQATTWCDDCTPDNYPVAEGNLFGEDPMFAGGAVEDLSSFAAENFDLLAGSPAATAGTPLDFQLPDFSGRMFDATHPSVGAFQQH